MADSKSLRDGVFVTPALIRVKNVSVSLYDATYPGFYMSSGVRMYRFPEPSKWTSNTATIVDSARNAAGYVVGSVIRENVASVEMSWNYISCEDWARLLKVFSIADGGKFYNTVLFFDQANNAYVERYMYISDRKAEMFRRDPVTKEILGWLNASVSLVEV